MNFPLFKTACALMALAIVLGAMGAHALERHLSIDQLSSFETGVRYQIYHALALLVIAVSYHHLYSPMAKWGTTLLLAGIACFSGSIYLFTTGNLLDVSFTRYIWWVTPLGGLFFIAGWIMFFRAAILVKK